MKRAWVYITALIGLGACPSKSGPDAAVAADAAVEIVDAGPAEPVDAGPPQPADLQLTITAQLDDGGIEVVTAGEIEPVKALAIWIPVPLLDYRLRVFDESDKVVPSDDQAHETDGGIDYAVTFLEPLKTGRTYRLTVEAQLGSALDGFKDAEVMMKVRGQIQPDKKPDKKKRR